MKVFTGEEPMNVVFLFSGGASSMKYVLESPRHNKLFHVVGALTNKPEEEVNKGWDIAKNYGIKPMYIDPGKHFTRKDFYAAVKEAVDEIKPDVVGLSGFLGKYSIIVDPFLDSYTILNVHPARLDIIAFLDGKSPWDLGRDEVRKRREDVGNHDSKRIAELIEKNGYERLYRGDDAVTMAVFFGENEVCSSVHFVRKRVDQGEIAVQSKRMRIDTEYVEKMLKRNALDKIVEYASGLQNTMKTECDGPAFEKTLELAAMGRLGTDHITVFLDEKELPYGGYQLGRE